VLLASDTGVTLQLMLTLRSSHQVLVRACNLSHPEQKRVYAVTPVQWRAGAANHLEDWARSRHGDLQLG